MRIATIIFHRKYISYGIEAVIARSDQRQFSLLYDTPLGYRQLYRASLRQTDRVCERIGARRFRNLLGVPPASAIYTKQTPSTRPLEELDSFPHFKRRLILGDYHALATIVDRIHLLYTINNRGSPCRSNSRKRLSGTRPFREGRSMKSPMR